MINIGMGPAIDLTVSWLGDSGAEKLARTPFLAANARLEWAMVPGQAADAEPVVRKLRADWAIDNGPNASRTWSILAVFVPAHLESPS